MHALVPTRKPFRLVRITQDTKRRRLSLAGARFRDRGRRVRRRFLCVRLEIFLGNKVFAGLVRWFAGGNDVGVGVWCGGLRCVGGRCFG